MTGRERLPNRRASLTFDFKCNGLSYCCTVSHYGDGTLGEIFISNAKVNSHSDATAKDAAVVCSIALQYGVPIDVIRGALLRDPRGIASSPLGVALDLLAAEDVPRTPSPSPRCASARPNAARPAVPITFNSLAIAPPPAGVGSAPRTGSAGFMPTLAAGPCRRRMTYERAIQLAQISTGTSSRRQTADDGRG